MSLQCKEGKKFPPSQPIVKRVNNGESFFPNVVHLMCVGGTPLAPLAAYATHATHATYFL